MYHVHRVLGLRLLLSMSVFLIELGATARAGLGKFGLIGGFTCQDSKVGDPLLNPNFRTKYFILGAGWLIAKNAKVHPESKLDVKQCIGIVTNGLQRVHDQVLLRLLVARESPKVSSQGTRFQKWSG